MHELRIAHDTTGPERHCDQGYPEQSFERACGRIGTEIGSPDMRTSLCRWGLVALLAAPRFACPAASPDELVPAVECRERGGVPNVLAKLRAGGEVRIAYLDRKSTRLNSSHLGISYA